MDKFSLLLETTRADRELLVSRGLELHFSLGSIGVVKFAPIVDCADFLHSFNPR